MYQANFSIAGSATAGTTIICTAGTTVFWKAPSDENGGGVTVLEAYAYSNAGTLAVNIVDLGASGTAVAGTIATCSLSSATPNTVAGTAAADYFLDGGRYVGLKLAAGTVTIPAGGWITYLPGR